MNTKVLRVVLASPGDVQPERDAMDGVIASLNDVLSDAHVPGLLRLYRWERDAYPGLHPAGPQGIIDAQLRIDESDLLIAVFWKRFGTPTEDAGSGTEHEIRLAIEGWRSKRAPQVMLYFKTGSFTPETPVEIQQWEALQKFRAELLAMQPPPLTWEVTSTEQFAAEVQAHIQKWMFDELRRSRPEIATPVLRYSFSTSPVVARSEGICELIGDCFVQCRLDPPAPPDRLLWFSAVLSFTVTITSRLQHSAKSALGEPFLLEIGRPQAVTYLKGNVHGNVIVFGPVQLPDIQPDETRLFLIGNIRCNASARGRGEIIANLTVSGAPVETPVQVVAYSREGLHFDVRAPNCACSSKGFQITQLERLPLSRIAVLRFVERFENAFKPRTAPIEHARSSVDPTVPMSESYIGPIVKVLGDELHLRGPADCGTRLQAVIHSIPGGLRLFVSARELANQSGLRATLIEAESNLVSREPLRVDDIDVRELLIQDGRFARATWEVTQPTAAWNPDRGTLDFGIYASTEPDQQPVTLGSACVNGCFAPTSVLTTAIVTAPVPRFLDTSNARILLTVRP